MIKFFIKLSLIFFSINFNHQLALSNRDLIRAIKERDIISVYTLLNSGIDTDSPDRYGDTALEIATSNCYIEGMEVLLDAHANPHALYNKGSTLLRTASISEVYRSSKVIIKPRCGSLS